MPRWLEITLTIVLFAALMGVAGVVVNATVPTVHGWLIEHIGQAGFWLLGGMVVSAGAVAAYLSARAERSKGTAGR